MDIVELQHLQATQKEMLRVYSQLCDKYGIQYFAMYGTLLGTVRHQGTIPWDCDIDVVMYRAEYEKFLKVSRELPKQYELRTIVYGDPNLTGLTRIIKKKTRIYVPGHETEKGEIHIDIFVFDYVESQGLTVLEAMALGVPCVVTKSRGPCEFIEDGINGLLTERSPESLTEKVLTILNEKKPYQRIKENTRCPEQFSPEQIMKQIETVIDGEK